MSKLKQVPSFYISKIILIPNWNHRTRFANVGVNTILTFLAVKGFSFFQWYGFP